jgi:NADH-quinone oxidoreductase subunit J
MGRVDLASVVFDGLALVTLGSAFVVAFARDTVRSAGALMVTLTGVAGLYATLSAGLLAVVQLFVYVGGTSTLLWLAIRFAPDASLPSSHASRGSRRGAAVATTLLAVALCVVAAGTIWPSETGASAAPSTRIGTARIGHALLGPYGLPFELASFVLLAALVGALVIARRPSRPGAPS